MTNSEAVRRKVQFIVASAMTVFFALVVVLAFQFAIRINQRSQERSLQAQRDEIQEQITSAQRDTDYYKTWRFIEDYALKYFGWGKEGQKLLEK